MAPRRTIYQTTLGWVVLGAWAVSYMAAIISPEYHPPPELNAALLVVVAAVFGAQAIGKQ